MPAFNQVRGTFGAEGSGQPAYNPWLNIPNALIYIDAEYQNPGSTAVKDLSGNNRNFTVGGGTAMNKTDSKGNRYWDLNTSSLIPTSGSDYITTVYPQVTYALWTRIKPNNTSAGSGDWRTLTRTITGGGHHVIVDVDGSAGARIGHWDGSFQNSNYQVASAGAATDGMQTAAGAGHGQWTFLVFKFQASNPQWQMFVNGNQTTAAAVMPVSANYASTSPLYSQGAAGWPGVISGCCNAAGGTSQFWGDIAAWAAWGSFVSAADLTRLYNETKHNFQLSPGWATARLRSFTSGSSYSEQLQVNYEYPATNFAVVSGSLPSGVSLNASTGVISGTPTGSSQTPTIRATFSNGVTSDQVVTISSAELYTFTTATFRGNSQGQSGPNLAQAQSLLGSPSWASTYLDMPFTGYQRWTVPATGNYQITAAGAGNNLNVSTNGAVVTSTFSLTQGEKLLILVGQRTGHYAGSGGGSGVARGADRSTATPLLIAGGAGNNGSGAASTSTSGNSSQNYSGQVNSGGNGAPSNTPNGSWSKGGGGFYNSGQVGAGNGNTEGVGFRQGGQGGNSASGAAYGGFGMGGGSGGHSNFEYSAGGGYSGAYAGSSSSYGGGGGSYSANGSFSSTGGNSGDGYVTITRV